MLDWTQVLMALIVGLPAIIAAVQGFRTAWKIDDNTKITAVGTSVAAKNAKEAADTATAAKSQIIEVKGMLNGSLDGKIEAMVRQFTEPIVKALADHVVATDRNIRDIMQAIGSVKDGYGDFIKDAVEAKKDSETALRHDKNNQENHRKLAEELERLKTDIKRGPAKP